MTGDGPSPSEFSPEPVGRASDEDLMRRTAAGDRAAFSILYERYNKAVLSYLFRMLGNVEDVESIGQEAFTRAFTFASTYRYPQKFSTWLFTITRNLAINNTRRRKRNPVRSFNDLRIENAEHGGDASRVAADASSEPDKREQIEIALRAIDELPPEQREVIVSIVMGGISYAELEEITSTKAVTLRSRMFHALRRLAGIVGQANRERPRPPA